MVLRFKASSASMRLHASVSAGIFAIAAVREWGVVDQEVSERNEGERPMQSETELEPTMEVGVCQFIKLHIILCCRAADLQSKDGTAQGPNKISQGPAAKRPCC